jgi:hypothetical protein
LAADQFSSIHPRLPHGYGDNSPTSAGDDSSNVESVYGPDVDDNESLVETVISFSLSFHVLHTCYIHGTDIVVDLRQM